MINKIDIQMTDMCNRRCKWCPMLQYSQNKIMDKYIIYKIKDIMDKYSYLFSENCKLTLSRYNEPLLYPDLMKEYLRILKNSKIKFKFTVNTNGDFLNKIDLDNYLKDIDLFIINNYDNIDEITAKINLMDYFRTYKILENMQHIPSEHLLRFNYNNTDIEYVYNKAQIMNTRDRGGSLSYNDNLHWINKNNCIRKSCDLIGNVLSIDVNGDVYPCCDTCGMIEHHHKICCGNILKDNFLTIYNKITNLQLFEDICGHCTTTYNTVIGEKNDNNSR